MYAQVFSLFNLLVLFLIQSGARINISEGNCPERIITLAGPTSAVFKASAMVIDKEEEDVNSLLPTAQLSGEPQSP